MDLRPCGLTLACPLRDLYASQIRSFCALKVLDRAEPYASTIVAYALFGRLICWVWSLRCVSSQPGG